MSLSDCPKCWETPCICGHEYEDWSTDKIEDLIDVLKKVLEEKMNKLKHKQM